MAADIQALADELAKLNKNSTLWAQPQIQQSGAAAMMTQNQVQLQPYMQNYSYATPGTMSPASQFADPRAANYALQQQYYMNPYRAQAYGGQFNEQLPGAEFSTSSRLGIYRPGQAGSQSNQFAQPGFFGDVAALSGFKSYAGYQNPYEEQIAASRRMTERAEMLTVGGLEAGGLAASMLIPGAAGLATGMAGLPMAAYGASQYFQRRQETGQIHGVMQDLVSGTSASGLTGRGVSMRRSSEMMRDFRMTAAQDPTKSIEDYQSIFQTGAATGLFNFEDSSDEISGKVKQASRMVNMMMMLAGDPDIQSTIKRMSDFQAMGVSIDQMDRMATDMKGFANLANTSFSEVMSRGGALGAQQAQMMGGSAAFGMRAGGMAQGMANRMLQSGYFTPEEAALRGGKSGIMQTSTSMMTNNIHSYLSTRAAMLMDNEGEFSQGGLDDLVGGKNKNTIGTTLNRFRGMNSSTYLMRSEEAVAQAEANLTPLKMIQIQKNIRDEYMRQARLSDPDDYYAAMGGKAGREMKYMLSNENTADIIMQENRVQQTKSSKRFVEAQQANRWYNKAARGALEFKEGIFDSEMFDDIAEMSDRRASAASGGVYRPGFEDTSFLDKGDLSNMNKMRFLQSSKRGELSYDDVVSDNPYMRKMLKGSMFESASPLREGSGVNLTDRGKLGGFLEAFDMATTKAGELGELKRSDRTDELRETVKSITEGGRLSPEGFMKLDADTRANVLRMQRSMGSTEVDEAFGLMRKASETHRSNMEQKHINKYKGDFGKAQDVFGKVGVKAYADLVGRGFRPNEIKAMLSNDFAEIGSKDRRDTLREFMNSSEGDSLITKFEQGGDLESGLQVDKLGILDNQSAMINAVRFQKSHADAGSTQSRLARAFATTKFDPSLSAAENERNFERSEEAKKTEEELSKEEIEENSKRNTRKIMKNAEFASMGGDSLSSKKTAMAVGSIEAMLRDYLNNSGLSNFFKGGNV